MARPSTGANLNVAQLERILAERKAAIAGLEKQRRELLGKLDAVEREIARLGGAAADATRRSRQRARNDKSLHETMEQVLREAGRPMKVAEITDAVQAAGYRSTSDHFRAIINQTLIKERKRFVSSGERGTYTVRR